MAFPTDFVWGAASSAYQIEGAVTEDGGGESIWDMFCRTPGKTWQGHSGFLAGEGRATVPGIGGQSGAVACDHYHRYKEDVALFREIGLKGYRMSTSWARVLPQGIGKPNAKGLDFYDCLIDELLKANITPFVTLYHWELPYELFCKGGWLNRDIVQWFGDYAALMTDRLSDRVQHWAPINEMEAVVMLGYQIGLLAPGFQLDFREVLRVAHHVLLSHGQAAKAIRAGAKKAPQIGCVSAAGVNVPATESAADIAAAKTATFSVPGKVSGANTWYCDPMYLGHYPADGLERFRADLPEIKSGDMELIHQPLDFVGVNSYEGRVVRAGERGPEVVPPGPFGHPMTYYHFAITPNAMYYGPKFFYERYGKPIYITENGMSDTEWISEDGNVHDPQRIDFLSRHLKQLGRAYDDGVDVRGYFQWSVMDVFEWHEGYRQRLGLIYVDWETQRRILKDSARWYKNVIATNGASLMAAAQGDVAAKER